MHSGNGPKNLKKSWKKNSWNQINQKFFTWNCISGSFNLFPISKIISWPYAFLKLQKMEFGEIVKWIYLISRVFLSWTFLIFWPTVKSNNILHTWKTVTVAHNKESKFFRSQFIFSFVSGSLSQNLQPNKFIPKILKWISLTEDEERH